MKSREKEFCRMMAMTGEAEKAARLAGYKRPENAWYKLLCRRDVAQEISENAKSLRTVFAETAASGLYRLAFGSQADAVSLLYREHIPREELETLDLSTVAEIKRTKDKSVEIKFFDRIKAMDKLHELLSTDSDASASGGLIEAMRLSAQALSGLKRDEGDDDAF